ncbi:MAG: glycosyltransferase [Candidatus Neomarinimicrobiota bacterium]|nr:MAG: glycosyltransferase [Candidatus Neomarinimicrobiota bacterium]
MVPRASLSACLIVKNEAAVLADCLRSIQSVVDEIIVLDTGSTDGTIDIARQWNAKVHHFSWSNHFAQARNASIQPATGDWILWLDADERLPEESYPALRECLVPVKIPTAVRVQIRSLKQDGRNYTLSDAHRLFSNHFGIQFSGRIHEQIAPSIRALQGVEKSSRIVLEHLGYSYTGEKAEAKRKRNENLLKRMAKEQPDSPYAQFTLGQHFALYRQYRKAVRCFQKALNLGSLGPEMDASLKNILADTLLKLKKPTEAKRWLEESLAAFPRQIGGYYLRYKLALEQQDLWGQIKALETVLAKTVEVQKEGKSLSTDIEIPQRDLEYVLVRLGLKTDTPDYVEPYAHRLRLRPELSYRERELLGRYYLSLGDWERAEEQLKKIYHDQPENTVILDLLGLLYLKQKKFAAAIHYYTLYSRLKPKEKAAKRRLAGLYAKTGETERAKEILAAL